MNNSSIIFYLVALSIIIFLLLREVFCWYYKINKRNKLLEELNKKQELTNNLLDQILKKLNQQ